MKKGHGYSMSKIRPFSEGQNIVCAEISLLSIAAFKMNLLDRMSSRPVF